MVIIMVWVMRKTYTIIVALSILLMSGTSFAYSTGISGFDALNLKLPSDGSGTISTAGSRGLKQWQPHFGLTTSFSYHLISARRNNQKIWLVNYAFAGDFVAALGIFDFLSIGTEIPFTVLENIKHNNTAISYNETSLGDIRFDVKGRILEDKSWYPGIAVIPSVFVPTGNENKFTGNTGLRYQGLLVVDKDFGPIYVSFNGGYRFVEGKTVVNTRIDDQMLYGIGVRIPLPVWERFEFIADGNGSSVVRNFSKATTSVEAIGGLRKTFKNGLRVDLAGGAGIIKSLGTPAFRVMVGLGYTMPKRKKKVTLPAISEMVGFSSSSWKIAPRYYDTLRSVGLKLIEYKNLQALIDGYTDITGPAYYNKKLSEKRAEEVKKYLIYFGGSENQLTAVGRSSENPVSPNNTREGRAKNRRVEITGGL
jgi:hypothetical protein